MFGKYLCNSVPHNKLLDLLKLRIIAFADDTINRADLLESICERLEKLVGNGENAGYLHFLLLPTMFSNVSFRGFS